jgi:OFA family oxalate/formate antiporter-like MFS transporter
METKTAPKDNTNRWTIVLGGLLINLMLGVTYAWGIFGSTLEKTYKWTTSDQTLAFSIMLLFFAITMPIAGRIQDKKGPRLVALIGGILLGIGFVTSSYAVYDKLMMYITYGVLTGAGVGFAYGAPIAAGSKWFPDKRGLIAGLMVFGFGFGSVLLAPIAQVMITGLPAQPKGLIQPLIVGLFQLPVISGLMNLGLQNTFTYLGLTFLVLICLGAMLLKNPPAGWKPEGWDPSKTKKAVSHAYKEFTATEMIKTKQFWMLWFMFMFTAAAGLMVIGFLNKFGEIAFREAFNYGDAAVLEGAVAISVLAIFNGAGRIFAGWLSDQIGRAKTMFILFGIQALMMASFVYLAPTAPFMVHVVMAMIGLCYGACFALFPASTADFFGPKNCGVNYGLVFTAYGVGGILGPMLAANLVPATPTLSSYAMPGLILGIFVGIAAVMAVFTKAPTKKE